MALPTPRAGCLRKRGTAWSRPLSATMEPTGLCEGPCPPLGPTWSPSAPPPPGTDDKPLWGSFLGRHSGWGHTPGRACGTHTDEKPKALVSTPEKTSMAMANDSHRNTRLACEVSVRNLRLMAPSWETRGHWWACQVMQAQEDTGKIQWNCCLLYPLIYWPDFLELFWRSTYKPRKNRCTWLFTEGLFVLSKSGKKAKPPSTGESL